MNVKKYEYVIDIFKGTCELNNYKASALIYERGNLSSFDIQNSSVDKIYYNGLIYDEKTDCLMGVINKLEPNTYSIGEVINIACKFLNNLEIDDYIVDIYSKEIDEELVSNLEAIDIAVDPHNKTINKDEKFSFTVSVDDKVIINGGVKEQESYFKMKYSDLDTVYDYNLKDVKTDVYVAALDKESLNDSFIIGSNLKDAGLKVEIDYSLKQPKKENIDASFLVVFDKEDIKKYQVKLIDMATEQIKEVGIDNLVEELAFI